MNAICEHISHSLDRSPVPPLVNMYMYNAHESMLLYGRYVCMCEDMKLGTNSNCDAHAMHRREPKAHGVASNICNTNFTTWEPRLTTELTSFNNI